MAKVTEKTENFKIVAPQVAIFNSEDDANRWLSLIIILPDFTFLDAKIGGCGRILIVYEIGLDVVGEVEVEN